MALRQFAATLAFAVSVSVFAEETVVELDPLFVSANRFDPTAERVFETVSSFDLQELQSDRFRDVPEAVNSYPGFGSFRRTNSVAAHPTTQGVRLRNAGANATSRTLVLYNGVPQNDPFGSWVNWHQFDLSHIEHLSIQTGGNADLWGNMASGGVVSMISKKGLSGSADLQMGLGTSGRLDLHARTAVGVSDRVVFDVGIRSFSTDGFYTLREDQRGPVDVPANSETTVANGQLWFEQSENWKSSIMLRYFEESRSNGTELSQNDTEAFDLGFVSQRILASQNATLNFNAYLQDRQFENVFASVSEDRTSERAALDQYDVPSSSYGAAAYYASDSEASFSFSLGGDIRFVDGELNERYRNLGDGFTRERNAGGEQVFAGVFTNAEFALSKRDSLTAAVRLDWIEQKNGHRIEKDTTNDTLLREDNYANRESELVSGSLNWERQLADESFFNVNAFSGFRAPTLNELYRPYRVRNDITEANPNLSNERTQGLEVSISSEVSETASVRFSAFRYELAETVANALITTESGFNPDFGFIPEGGSGSIRSNIDESTVSGFELQSNFELTDTLTLDLAAVYAETEIEQDELNGLSGNSFPQSPPWKARATLDWDLGEKWSAWLRYSWSDRRYENLSNTIRLGATSDLSLGARYELNETSSLSFTLTNALDEENVTGIASNGLVTIDEPRELLLTYRWRR